MFTRTLPIAEARHLPRWRQPTTLLFLMAVAMPLAFATWSALLNNFVIEAAGFTGVEIGWLHTVREIPGLLAVGVLLFLLVIREQVMAGLMLILLGSATASELLTRLIAHVEALEETWVATALGDAPDA